MAVHLVLRVEQRVHGVGMAELHLIAVEPAVLADAESLLQRDPHHHRLHRGADGRHRDAVVRVRNP